MFFPANIEFVLSVVDTSRKRILLGKRSSGVGGNQSQYKSFDRLLDLPLAVAMRRKSSTSQDAYITERFEKLMPKAFLERMSAVIRKNPPTADQLISEWGSFCYSFFAFEALPEVRKFVLDCEQMTLEVESMWERGDTDSAAKLIATLPWAHCETIQWFLEKLQQPDLEITDDLLFPVQLLSTIIVVQVYLRHFPAEQVDDQVEGFAKLVTAKHPETGELSAIRHVLDTLKDWSRSKSLNDFFDLALSDYMNTPSDRRREGRKYRANDGPVPSLARCLSIVENCSPKLPAEDMNSFRFAAGIGCYLQKANNRCKAVREVFPDFGPMLPFSDVHVLTTLPTAGLLAIPNIGTASNVSTS